MSKQNKVKAAYKGGRCPDCRRIIPNNATEGSSCSGCGHVFYSQSKPVQITVKYTVEKLLQEMTDTMARWDGDDILKVAKDVLAGHATIDASTMKYEGDSMFSFKESL